MDSISIQEYFLKVYSTKDCGFPYSLDITVDRIKECSELRFDFFTNNYAYSRHCVVYIEDICNQLLKLQYEFSCNFRDCDKMLYLPRDFLILEQRVYDDNLCVNTLVLKYKLINFGMHYSNMKGF